MDRMKEFEALNRELEQVPSALEFTVTRAKARAKSKKRLKWAGIPVGGLAGTFAAFVLMINAVPTFALACSGVPFLADLAAAVDWSGSLKAAVENQYVQPVGQSQTRNGITLTIDYLIVDQKQLNLFLTTENENQSLTMTDLDWDVLSVTEGCSILDYGEHDNGVLRRITFDFGKGTMPSELELKFSARPFSSYESDAEVTFEEARAKDPAAEFVFTIQFDPAFTASGEVLDIGRWVELDGQRIYVEQLEVYPSHARLRLRDDTENTLRLVDFNFYLEDGDGARYEMEGGLTGLSDPDTGFAFDRRVGSPWFSRSKHLTLCITGVSWLDEDARTVTVDLVNKTAEGLPEGVVFEGIREYGDQKTLNFRLPYLPSGSAFDLFTHEYTDPEGNVYEVNSWGSSTDESGTFQHHYYLNDYPYDTVELFLERSAWHSFEQPVTIEVK